MCRRYSLPSVSGSVTGSNHLGMFVSVACVLMRVISRSVDINKNTTIPQNVLLLFFSFFLICLA